MDRIALVGMRISYNNKSTSMDKYYDLMYGIIAMLGEHCIGTYMWIPYMYTIKVVLFILFFFILV